MMHLPGTPGDGTGQEFVLTRSFVPRGKPNILTAFMVGRSDPGHYGQLVVYNTPQNSSAPSPLRAANLIESNPAISRQFSLLDQRGSQVLRGEVQLLPMRDSVVYVRPIWVQGEVSQSFPVFNYVAMTYGDSSVLASDIDTGIAELLHTRPVTTPTTPTTPTSPTTPTGPENATAAALLQLAQTQYNEAQQALLTNGAAGLNAYQQHIAAMQSLITRAIAELNKPASTTPTTPTTKPATTTTTKAPTVTTSVPPTSG
jgi:uncharacterized membrane protein (UPF0182 family)